MAKFAGNIGFIKTVKKKPGIAETEKTEKFYVGDVIRNKRRWKEGSAINDDLAIQNEISIIADSFALENMGYMKYVVYLGTKWKIEEVTIDRPRITLTLGGVWNG